MEPILNDFAQIAREIIYHRPQLSLISNLTGDFITDEIATPEYWCLHIRQTVKFAQSIATLQKHNYKILLEIGPQPILLGMSRTATGTSFKPLMLPSLRLGISDWQQLLQSLSELYLKGYKINWLGFDQEYSRRLVSLPSYPFQRQRYWAQNATDFITTFATQVQSNSILHPLLGQPVSIADSSSILFQTNISQNSPVYLQDHCLGNTSVFPAAAYLEMAIAASSSLYPKSNIQLKNFCIEQPLTLSEDVSKTIQLILDPIESKFKVFSINETQIKIFHAQGELVINEKSQPKSVNLQAIKNEFHQVIAINEYYQTCQKQGLNYGNYFQSLQKLLFSKKQALGLIKLSNNLQLEAKTYHLHPTLLDASFQVTGAILEQKQDLIYLPVGLESIQV
jgi:myxalamid-type polyketide synthase MxaB